MADKKARTPAQIAATERMKAARAERAAEKSAEEKPLTEAEVDRAARDDKKAMGKMLAADEKVTFMIPYDPGNPKTKYWERSLNGLILRFERGIPLEQPKYIADYVNRCLTIEERAMARSAAFREKDGKKLGEV